MSDLTTTETEDELIRRSQAGDLDAFNRLVELYQNGVYGLCLRMLSLREAAEDAAQETFISAFTHIQSFRQGSFRSWLLRIAANACYDELRRRGRRPAVSLDLEPDDDEAPFEVAGGGPAPDDLALRKELRAAIERGLQGLPEDQRLALILCDLQELSYEEVVEATGASLGTVKSRISRGRARLREYLRGQGELLPDQYR